MVALLESRGSSRDGCRLSEQVRAEAVTVLKRAGDKELGQYLLQLSAALRYESRNDSQLARFLLHRCPPPLNP